MKAVGGIAATACGIAVAILGTFHNRRRAEKDSFIVFISQKVGVAEQLPVKDHWSFYLNTKGEITNMFFRLRPFLWKKDSVPMDDWWKRYSEIKQADFIGDNESGFIESFHVKGVVDFDRKNTDALLIRALKQPIEMLKRGKWF